MPGGGSKPGERRGGRQKGTPNKLTGELKEMIMQALKDAGGAKYLQQQATATPAAFISLLGRLVPFEIGAGAGKGKITVSWEGEGE